MKNRRSPASLVSNWGGVQACIFSSLCILGGCLFGCKPKDSLAPPAGYEQVRDELLAGGEFRHYPVIDPTGRWLVFARNKRKGVEYGLVDLRDRSVAILAEIHGKYEGTLADLYAWSPDGRWLAWVEREGSSGAWTVKVRDNKTGAVGSTGLKLVFQDLIWIGPEQFGVRYGEYLMVVERDGEVWRPNYGRRFSLTFDANKPRGNEAARTNHLRGIDWKTLTLSEPDRVAYGLEGNLFELDLISGKVARLTDWPEGKIRWLDYSVARKCFLFSVASTDDAGKLSLMNWHRDADAESSPLQLTDAGVSALKGRWLPGGYSYLADQPDRSQLVVVWDDGAVTTNFASGSIWSYAVGGEGTAFAAIASANMEPLGLWRVNSATGEEEAILAGKRYIPLADRRSLTNAELRRLNYTVFRPERTNVNSACPVLFLPTQGRLWSELSRVLPRLDIIQVMPGLDKNTIGDAKLVHEALLTVRAQIVRDYPVDTNRFYLEGISASSAALQGIIEASPGVFRGVIVDSPAPGGLPDAKLLKREGLELLVTIGTKDEYYQATKGYVKDARRLGVKVWFEEIEGMEHTPDNSEQLEQRIRAMVSFIHRSAPAKP